MCHCTCGVFIIFGEYAANKDVCIFVEAMITMMMAIIVMTLTDCRHYHEQTLFKNWLLIVRYFNREQNANKLERWK